MPSRRLHPLPAICALAVAALFGCMDGEVAGGSGVGNPPQGTATFAMVASPGAPLAKGAIPTAAARSLLLADAGGMRFELRTAVVHVSWVRLRTPAGRPCHEALNPGCEGEDLRLDGPFVADLLSGTLSPALPDFQAPAGAYRRIESRFGGPHPGESGLETLPAARGLVLSGTFAYAGRGDRTFNLSLDFDESVRFEGGSMTVRQDALTHLLLRFPVESWLAGADIGRCLDEGRLTLDLLGNLDLDGEDDCEGLEKALREAVKASGRMSERRPEED